jgi:hypothetical protein
VVGPTPIIGLKIWSPNVIDIPIAPIVSLVRAAVIQSNRQLAEIKTHLDLDKQSLLSGFIQSLTFASQEGDVTRIRDVRDGLGTLADFYLLSLDSSTEEFLELGERRRVRIERLLIPALGKIATPDLVHLVSEQSLQKSKLAQCYLSANLFRYAEMLRMLALMLINENGRNDTAIQESLTRLRLVERQAHWGKHGFTDLKVTTHPLSIGLICQSIHVCLNHSYYTDGFPTVAELEKNKSLEFYAKKDVAFQHFFGNYMPLAVRFELTRHQPDFVPAAGSTPAGVQRAFDTAYFGHARIEHFIRGARNPSELLSGFSSPPALDIPIQRDQITSVNSLKGWYDR